MSKKFPLWSDQLSAPPALPKPKKLSGTETEGPAVVYFPTCISRLLGSGAKGKKSIMETFLSVSAKAGIGVVPLDGVRGGCCGQIFSSKGFEQAYRFKANDMVDRIWKMSWGGRLPVITDLSSCAHTLSLIRPQLSDENKLRYDKLSIMDSISYLHDMVLARNISISKKGRVVLHPVCSLQKMALGEKFLKVAEAFASQVSVPLHAGCCGMAGDRGFLFPELVESATKIEADEVGSSVWDGYYSSSKTCEMAMSEAVRANYESILYLADECTC